MFTWAFGDCCEGGIPRSLLRFQAMMPRSLLRGISLISKLGEQPNLVAERLGHEKIQTTLSTYAHLYPNQARNLADQLNGLMDCVDDEEEGDSNAGAT